MSSRVSPLYSWRCAAAAFDPPCQTLIDRNNPEKDGDLREQVARLLVRYDAGRLPATLAPPIEQGNWPHDRQSNTVVVLIAGAAVPAAQT
jgi:hypothetical protein